MLTDLRDLDPRAGRLVVVALLLLGLGAGVAVAPRAEAATRRYNYFQFNACDNACTDRGTHAVRADRIVDSLVDWSNGYLFASLNELCRSTAEDIVTSAQSRGLNIGGHFTQTKGVAPNCPNGSFGNMVMHPGQRLDVGETILAYDGSDEIRKLTCVSTNQPGQLRMCTTHITADPDFQNAQVVDVQRIVNPYATGAGYIAVGGDFNQEPYGETETLDMYHGYGGYFDDVDRRYSCNDASYNQPTFPPDNTKIDYTFVDHTRFSCYGGVVTSTSVSDHLPLRGAADLSY